MWTYRALLALFRAAGAFLGGRRRPVSGAAYRPAVFPAALLAVLLAASCTADSFGLEAAGPYVYPAAVKSPLERVAIVVTLTNHSGDDLPVNPVDFVARDAGHRIYPANPTATVADADLVRVSAGIRGALPLSVATLRQDEVLSGFVVFDVPSGVRPVDLIFRQADADRTVRLAAAR